MPLPATLGVDDVEPTARLLVYAGRDLTVLEDVPVEGLTGALGRGLGAFVEAADVVPGFDIVGDGPAVEAADFLGGGGGGARR